MTLTALDLYPDRLIISVTPLELSMASVTEDSLLNTVAPQPETSKLCHKILRSWASKAMKPHNLL